MSCKEQRTTFQFYTEVEFYNPLPSANAEGFVLLKKEIGFAKIPMFLNSVLSLCKGGFWFAIEPKNSH